MLTLLTILGLFLSPAAHGADISCDTMKDAEPMSLYTKTVVKRIKKGKEIALSGGSSENPMLNAIRWAGSAVVSTIDSYQRVLEQIKDLPLRTTCEQYDIVILECQLEDIRTAINKALENKEYGSAYKLQSLYLFINQRLRGLFIGSRDPRYKDLSWNEPQPFDPIEEVWCCIADDESIPEEERGQCRKKAYAECTDALTQGIPTTSIDACTTKGCQAPKEEKEDTNAICPFSSNYFPAGNDLYGCSEELLKKMPGYGPAEKELDVLRKLNANLKNFREKAKELSDVEKKIQVLLGLAPEPEPEREEEGDDEKEDEKKEEEKQKVFEGCIVGECSNNPTKGCGVDKDCGEEGAVCRRGKRLCNGSEDCKLEELPLDFLAWEIRGPFSVERDEPKLLDIFGGQRERETRLIPKDLQSGGGASSAAGGQSSSKEDDNFFIRTVKLLRISQLKSLSAAQNRAEADMFARGADPALQIAEAMADTRASGSDLSKLAGDKQGLRQLVVRFAWYLRRTCIDSACNKRLEQIIRFAQTDSCFPYVSGAFLGQTCEDPQWKKCLEEAKLDKDFTPPELECE